MRLSGSDDYDPETLNFGKLLMVVNIFYNLLHWTPHFTTLNRYVIDTTIRKTAD